MSKISFGDLSFSLKFLVVLIYIYFGVNIIIYLAYFMIGFLGVE